MSESATPAPGSTLEEIAEDVAYLRDLFQRRLLDDKARSRLYDELYAQVTFAREGLVRTYLKPLYGELLLVVDRLRPVEGEVAASVVLELEEILRRRGVHRMTPRDRFDPGVHEAARVEHSATVPRGEILAVLRNGYVADGEVLRPAAVVVSAGPPAASTTCLEHEGTAGSDD